MRLDAVRVLVDELVDLLAHIAREALGGEPHHGETGLVVARRDRNGFLEQSRGLSVLADREEQTAPAHARTHRLLVGRHRLAELVIGGAQVAERPLRFGPRERIARPQQRLEAGARLGHTTAQQRFIATAQRLAASRVVIDVLRADA